MKTTEFIEHLRAHQNPEKQKPMEQYMKNQFSFIGLQATERRALSKEFIKARFHETKNRYQIVEPGKSVIDWDLLTLLWELPEREFQLTGLDYLKRVEIFFVYDDFDHFKKLILQKSWWDTIDFLAKNIGSLVKKEPQLVAEIKAWSRAESMWMRRVAILHQLSYKDETNHALLQEIILNNIHDEEFFIRKAIGWSLREYSKTNADWVRAFVAQFQTELSPLSYREATKYL